MVCECGGAMCDCDMAHLKKLLTTTHKLIAFGILSQFEIGGVLMILYMQEYVFYGVRLQPMIAIIVLSP